MSLIQCVKASIKVITAILDIWGQSKNSFFGKLQILCCAPVSRNENEFYGHDFSPSDRCFLLLKTPKQLQQNLIVL